MTPKTIVAPTTVPEAWRAAARDGSALDVEVLFAMRRELDLPVPHGDDVETWTLTLPEPPFALVEDAWVRARDVTGVEGVLALHQRRVLEAWRRFGRRRFPEADFWLRLRVLDGDDVVLELSWMDTLGELHAFGDAVARPTTGLLWDGLADGWTVAVIADGDDVFVAEAGEGWEDDLRVVRFARADLHRRLDAALGRATAVARRLRRLVPVDLEALDDPAYVHALRALLDGPPLLA